MAHTCIEVGKPDDRVSLVRNDTCPRCGKDCPNIPDEPDTVFHCSSCKGVLEVLAYLELDAEPPRSIWYLAPAAWDEFEDPCDCEGCMPDRAKAVG